jgi:HEAT repeat protein/PBS lyase HEAT-like repeat-containing protein
MAVDTPSPLAPEETGRLTAFARACKAAARAVVLYPPSHPAIATTLGRIASITAPSALTGSLKISVRSNALLLDGRAPARPDEAIAELAELLHAHLIGEITVHPGGDIEAWRSFLLLLGRSSGEVRADGGISRLWTTMGGRHLELREIDYSEVLREHAGGQAAVWEQVIARCLQGDALNLDDEAINMLVGIAGDPRRFPELVAELDAQATASSSGVSAKTAALVRMLRAVAEAVAKTAPDQLEPILRNMATAVGQVSPDVMLELLSQRSAGGAEGQRVVGEIVRRMSDQTIATFVARNVIEDGTSTDRLAQAFHALVPDEIHRHRLLALAHDDVASTPLGRAAGFDSLWNNVSEMLTSYSDSSFVSDEYGRELSSARTQAIEVERVSDDPPDRINAWLGTVAISAVRALDLTLLLDLLRIEQDAVRWRDLMRPIVAQIEDQLLVGDFEAAQQLATVLVTETGTDGTSGRKSSAARALEQLASGPMMRHIVSHLATIDETQFGRVKELCLAIGNVLVRPLAEALSTEERGGTRERLTALLIAFGATGRQTVERLKGSPNPAVRRTAIYLLREFGGNDALPDLTLLLDDSESQVQREALRAILDIGTDAAYAVLQQALVSGTVQSREAIMRSIALLRDERATPLFAYIVGHVNHRGALLPIYLSAIESLGALRDPAGVQALKTALYRGEWWAPRRTARLRAAAADALARTATPEAIAVLREAAESQSRSVRSAAQPQLARAERGARIAAEHPLRPPTA